MTSQDLVPGINPLELVRSREEILATVRQSVEGLMLANEQAKAAGFGVMLEAIADVLPHCDYCKDPKAVVEAGLQRFGQRLDTRGWDCLLNASGLRTFMDTAVRKEWDQAINKCDTPTLDAGTIEATFRAIHADRGLMVERGVIGVFRRLSWDYKTNQPCLFGKKIIVPRFVDYHGNIEPDCAGLEDLLRALCIYDGKPEPDHRASIYGSTSCVRGPGQWSNDYLEIQWFKNGNAHATFKRPDLVDKLNAVLSKHYPGALPAAR